MENIEKVIKVNDNRIIRYNISDGYIPIHTIREDFLENGKLIKNYQFSRWDDYGFKGYVSLNFEDFIKINQINYDFDINHPFYIPLLHLLNGEKELIIDDDETYELNKKYMKIYKEEEKIIIKFIYELEDEYVLEKFYVFIKNIGPDIRSKIDCLNKDTKERLYLFYEDIYKIFIEEYHQITIEEYLLQHTNILTLEESKKYIRKMNL